jgi:hypothetical protein
MKFELPVNAPYYVDRRITAKSGDGRLIRGARITDCFTLDGEVWFRWMAESELDHTLNSSLRVADEGVTWAKGWDGPDVEALKVAEALA